MASALQRWGDFNSSRAYLAEWVAEAAATCRPTDRVLDAGAGDAPYRRLFDGTSYETADFAMVDKQYGHIDHICDLTDIPVEDGRFDLVLCTQTFEHLVDPVAVLREFRRVLKSTGSVWLSAPLFYPEHEQPHDYHRYTQFAWRRMADEAGFVIDDLDWLEGYLGTVGFQLSMVADAMPRPLRPLRYALRLLAGLLNRLDRRWKVTDVGMCKNYRLVLRPTGAHA